MERMLWWAGEVRAVREFEFPEPWELSPQNPEPGAPASIEHCCDCMKGSDGGLEFHYNYFSYVWKSKNREFRGRSYNDDIYRIVVFLPFVELDVPALQPEVLWLQRRFNEIDTFEKNGDGYVRRWKLKPIRSQH